VKNLFKISMLATVAATAMAVSAPVFAQQAEPQDAEAADEGEIIVTASKREQTLQDVPISVSVTSAQQVERAQINDLIDLQSVVPSLKVPQFQSATQTNFVIRGFGNGANNLGIESSVGVFIDGVYRSRSASAIADLPEIERVEVLRGPQSTLFGKNVSAGAISIITRKPQFKFGLKAEATAGNYGSIQGNLSATGPLSENIAVRLSGSFDTREGYFTNTNAGGEVNDRNRYSGRLDILLEPSDTASFRLIADYNRINEVCCGAVPIFNGPVTLAIGAPVASGGLGAAIGNTNRIFEYELAYDENPVNTLTGKGISLQGDFDFGLGKLTSITALRNQTADNNLDVDFTGARIVNQLNTSEISSFTQELRLASDGDGPLTWLIGGFYGDETIKSGEDIRWGPQGRAFVNQLTGGLINLLEGLQAGSGVPNIVPGATYIQAGQGVNAQYRLKNRSYSLFAQADYELFEKLTISGGVAYLNDRKAARSTSLSNDAFARLDLNNVANIGLLPFGALPAGVAGCLLQKGYNPAANGGRVPANLLGTSLGTSLPGPGSAPCPVSLPGVNPFSLAGVQFLSQPIDYPNATENGILTGDKITYMGRLAYDFSRRLNAYVSYSKGWKAGAFNLSRDSRPPNAFGIGRTAAPEDVTVYELGIKGNFPGGFLNLAVFKQSIKDFQSNAFTGTGFNLVNAGKQSVKGFEIDAAYKPFGGLSLGLGVTYLDPKYDSFLRAACPSVRTVDPACAIVPATGTTPAFAPTFRDLSGRTPAGISKWSANFSGTYDFELSDGWNGFVRAEYIYSSRAPISEVIPENIASVQIDTINASIGIGNADKLEAQLWVRNLTKDKYLQGGFESVAQSGSYAGYPSAPRTYGVTLRKTF
jgi:iron complex outermembrane recepter protein